MNKYNHLLVYIFCEIFIRILSVVLFFGLLC